MRLASISRAKARRLITLLACCLMIAGCAAPQDKPVEITLLHGWGSTEDDHEAMRQIYAGFEQQHPGIRLHTLSLPTAQEVKRKLEDMLMVGDVPDIVFLNEGALHSTYPFMVRHGFALDMMPHISMDAAFAASLAPANLSQWLTKDNQLYTVSDVLILCGGYWYNRDIFQAAGITQLPRSWEELESMCAQIAQWSQREQNGVIALQPSLDGYRYLADALAAVQLSHKGEPLHSIGQADMAAVLDTLRAFNRYALDRQGSYSFRDETELFNEGKLALYINGAWGEAMIAEGIDAAYAPMPGDQWTSACEAVDIGYMLGNTGDQARQNASLQFVKYMLSEAVQTRILLETRQVAANPNIDIAAFADKLPRLVQAVTAIRQADKLIGIPEHLWTQAQTEAFARQLSQ